MKLAKLYKKLGDSQVQCLACSWYCRIGAGQLGVCRTRLNQKGKLYSLVYAKAIGLHPDPVEKKPLFHFLPGQTLVSFGTVGCNFGCLFCQNWDMSQINKTQNARLKTQNLLSLIDRVSVSITPKEIVNLALEQGAAGIAYTYNEPAIFVEFAHDTAVLAKKQGLKNVYVSNGFESKETFAYLRPYLDAINIDLKSFSSKFYTQICKAKIEPVKENIKRFFAAGIETEVTTLLIPRHNDSDQELKAIARFLASISKDIPWHISAFHPDYLMQAVAPTKYQDLVRAYKIGKRAGLKYIYLGNVAEDEYSHSFCPRCQVKLVDRTHYQGKVMALDVKTGRCQKCREKIYGVWS